MPGVELGSEDPSESEARTPVAGIPLPTLGKKRLHDSDEIEAQAHLLEARTALIQAKWSFWDRLIMRGLIPFAMLVGGPGATYYFHQRAETSDANQKRMEALIASNEALGKRLEQILVITVARKEVTSYGVAEIASEVSALDRPDFLKIRDRVERRVRERVAAQVGDGPHVDAAVRGAVDEVAPGFEEAVRARGGHFEAPTRPRFFNESQKK